LTGEFIPQHEEGEWISPKSEELLKKAHKADNASWIATSPQWRGLHSHFFSSRNKVRMHPSPFEEKSCSIPEVVAM
jgi:hypothetical protein